MAKNHHALVTGLFLTGLVTATIIVVLWLGHFQKERNRYVVSTHAAVSGLNPESIVFFRGIAVGKVINIQFDPNDTSTILIPIEVDKDIILTEGTYAILQFKGVTGLTQLEMEDSGKISKPIPPGDNPKFRIPIQPSLTDKLLNSGEEILHKTDRLMVRLNALLSDENEKNINSILNDLKNLTEKLQSLEQSVDKALMEVPSLSKDAHETLQNINGLTKDLANLSKTTQDLSLKAGRLADTGTAAGAQINSTTLPKLNQLLTDLQATSGQIKRAADLLESQPQSLLLGRKPQETPAPGEPNYQEPK